MQVPKPVQGQQAAGRIRRPTAHAGLGWNAFFDGNVHPLGAAGVLLQQLGCTGDQVGGREGRGQVLAADGAARPFIKVQRVAPVDQHEDRLQQVVTVGAPTGDVQKQVEFGWSGNVVQRFHAEIIASARAEGSAVEQDAQQCLGGGRYSACAQTTFFEG